MHIIEIDTLLAQKNSICVVDVRSEGEFNQGHIEGAINIPLLNNEERVKVGTTYKEKGNEAAVLLGYELVGSKFSAIIHSIKLAAPTKHVIVHCWRGGLRSRIVCQLLENAGFQVSQLKGGYKSYRHWVLQLLSVELPLHVIGGLTGSGKTALLHELHQKGEQIIDLEGLASHKGSTFGGIGQAPQPTQEHFENKLAEVVKKLDLSKRIWIEDESRMIGTIALPLKLWECLRYNILYELNVHFEYRLQRIIVEYCSLPKNILEEKTSLLRKRLGDLRLKEVLIFLQEGNMHAWAEALLVYYDKSYHYGQSKRDSRKRVKLDFRGTPSASIFLTQAEQLQISIDQVMDT